MGYKFIYRDKIDKDAPKNEHVIAIEKNNAGNKKGFVYVKEISGKTEKNIVELTDEKNHFEMVPFITPHKKDPPEKKEDEYWDAMHFFIFGMTGSGKSYWINKTVNNLKKQDKYKNHEVYLICDPGIDDDPSFHFDRCRIDLKKPEFYNEATWKDFKNGIVIFDDIDALSKGALNFIRELQKQLVQNGRKEGIVTFNVSHSAKNWKHTKYVCEESTYIVCFPTHNWNMTQNFLKDCLKYDKNELSKIKHLETRALVLRRSYPNYYISEDKIEFIE